MPFRWVRIQVLYIRRTVKKNLQKLDINRFKRGQTGSKGVKHGQLGSTGVNQGQPGSNGVKWGQTGSNVVKQVQTGQTLSVISHPKCKMGQNQPNRAKQCHIPRRIVQLWSLKSAKAFD